MSINPPPINELLAEGNGLPKIPWILFFNQLFEGDPGTEWAPTFVNLGVSGSPQITGRYYRLNQRFCVFYITITPNGGNTTSTAGATYCDNFPLQFSLDSVCWAVSGGLGDGPGHIVAATNRIYTPAWAAVTVPLTVVGFGVAS